MDVSTTCEFLGMFPAPLEVDGYLYMVTGWVKYKNEWFPTPREVDRWIYSEEAEREARYFLFPAPLEVDRYLYDIRKFLPKNHK